MPKCFKMRERRGPKGRVHQPRPPAGGLNALKCENSGVPKAGFTSPGPKGLHDHKTPRPSPSKGTAEPLKGLGPLGSRGTFTRPEPIKGPCKPGLAHSG